MSLFWSHLPVHLVALPFLPVSSSLLPSPPAHSLSPVEVVVATGVGSSTFLPGTLSPEPASGLSCSPSSDTAPVESSGTGARSSVFEVANFFLRRCNPESLSSSDCRGRAFENVESKRERERDRQKDNRHTDREGGSENVSAYIPCLIHCH